MRARPNGADASGTVVIKKDHRLEGGNIFHDRLTRIRTDGCLPVDYAREFRATRCSLNAQQISVSARYRLELEIPRNPTVVLFLKIPRVLCSHPLTGGPGIILIISILFAPSIRVEPRCFRVVPESFHRLDVAIGKAVVASFVVTQGRTAPIGVVARHTVRTLACLGIAEHPCAGLLRRCFVWRD